MKNTLRKKLLLILIPFFVLFACLSAWYFFIYRCNTIPKQFSYLENFITTNQCKSKEFEIKGVLYNLSTENNHVVFDLNLWDEKNKESFYQEGISLNLDNFQNPGSYEFSTLMVDAVKLKINLQNSSNTVLKYEVSSWNIEPLNLGEPLMKEALEVIYKTVNTSPTSNTLTTTIENKDYLSPITKIIINEDGTVYPTASDGIDVLSIYRLWVNSLAYDYAFINEIEDFDKYIGTEINNSTVLRNYMEKEFSKDQENIGCENETILLDNTIQSNIGNKSLGCLISNEIIQNTNLTDSKTLLLDKYCIKEEKIANLETLNLFDFSYTINDLYGAINTERINNNITSEDNGISLSNELSFLADIFSAQEIYNSEIIITEKNINDINTYIANRVLNFHTYNIREISTLAFSSNIANMYNSNPFYESTLENIYSFSREDIKKTLQLMESDITATALYSKSYDNNEFVQNLEKINLLKTITLNFFNEGNKKGIWESNGTYDVRDNAWIFKILLENYE